MNWYRPDGGSRSPPLHTINEMQCFIIRKASVVWDHAWGRQTVTALFSIMLGSERLQFVEESIRSTWSPRRLSAPYKTREDFSILRSAQGYELSYDTTERGLRFAIVHPVSDLGLRSSSGDRESLQTIETDLQQSAMMRSAPEI